MTRLLRTNIFVACFVGCYFFFSFVFGILQTLIPGLAGQILLVNASIYLLSFGLPALIYVWIIRKKTGEPLCIQLGLHPISGVDLLLVILCAFLIQPVMMLISSISQLFFQNITSSSMVEMSHMPLWAMLLSIGIFPAFFEELVCRGVILQGHRDTPLWYQLLIPAVFFGLLHSNFQQAIYAAAAGVFMALLVRFTGSLWSSIAAHLVVNCSQSIMVWTVTHIEGYSEILAETEAVIPAGSSALLLALIPVLMLTAIVLPLLILCMIKLYQRGRSRSAANRTALPHWHRGAWPMYVVLGFLLCYTILTEIMLYFML